MSKLVKWWHVETCSGDFRTKTLFRHAVFTEKLCHKWSWSACAISRNVHLCMPILVFLVQLSPCSPCNTFCPKNCPLVLKFLWREIVSTTRWKCFWCKRSSLIRARSVQKWSIFVQIFVQRFCVWQNCDLNRVQCFDWVNVNIRKAMYHLFWTTAHLSRLLRSNLEHVSKSTGSVASP